MPENKIQLVVEAYNMSKATLDALGKQIKAIGDESSGAGQKHNSAFQKMKENWVAISVVAAEVMLVAREAWQYMAEGAKAQQAEDSFRSVAAAAGESADEILEAMKRAANGTMDDSAIMQKAVKGLVQGLSGDQMVSIMEAARVSARVAGEDVQTAYEGITDAIANKMPRALQRYGLVTKEQVKLLSEAMSMGITDVDLYGLAMENAGKQAEKFGALQDTNAEKMQKWKAIFNEVKEFVGKAVFWIIDNVIGRLFNVVANVSAIVADLFARIGALWNWMTGGFKGGVAALNKELAIADEALRGQLQENNAKYAPTSTKTAPPGNPRPGVAADGDSATQDLKNILAMKAREAAVNRELAQLDTAELERTVTHQEAARERLRLEQELLKVQEANLSKINDPNARAGKQKEIDDTIKKIAQLKLALQDFSGTFEAGIKEGLTRYLEGVRTAFQNGVELARQTAQAMEQAFSDFFFDAMTGKLKHFSDYLKEFLYSIARIIAQMLAQQTTAGIVASIGTSAGSTAAATHHSGGVVGYVPRFHAGGLNSDERMVINKVGERYITKEQNEWLTRIAKSAQGNAAPPVTVQVINQSSQPVNAKQTGIKFDGKAFVLGVVLSDLENGGPIRSAVSGLNQ